MYGLLGCSLMLLILPHTARPQEHFSYGKSTPSYKGCRNGKAYSVCRKYKVREISCVNRIEISNTKMEKCSCECR